MFFLADEFNAELQTGERGRTWGSYLRKAREIMMSLALERRASKDEILELYLNDVYLGQRGSFAIHGVAEASRIFFGKDVSNISISEAATIAGTIKYPGLPFANPKRAIERRNIVLQAMASEEFITADAAVQRVARAAADRSARRRQRGAVLRRHGRPAGRGGLSGADDAAGRPSASSRRSTSTCSGPALEAVRNGLARVDELLVEAAGGRPAGPAQAALIAVDPRTGEILALVGGRSYNTSQYNRVTTARRQPGSVFKPFVYLAAFERGAEEGRTDLTPASLTRDEPGIFEFDGQVWEPKNYDDYDGEVTWRRALAMSRNLGTIHVGEQIGFDTVARLWRRVGVGTPPQAVPSITLGVFELTPLEVAQAYTLFTNGGTVRPLKGMNYIQAGAREAAGPSRDKEQAVARPDTTFLVTNMLRSVLNEGTGAARARQRLRARCRRQERHDQRSARRLVRRLHARAPHRRLGRLRRQHADRPDRLAGGAPDLDRVHEGRPRRPRPTPVRAARRDHLRRDRPRHRQARHAQLPAHLHRVVHHRHRAARNLPAALRPRISRIHTSVVLSSRFVFSGSVLRF